MNYQRSIWLNRQMQHCVLGQRLRTRLELLTPDLSARIEQKSGRIDPMVKRNFKVGEPVLARDYRNLRTAWTKGVIQDR